MERLFFHNSHEVLKARKAEPYETFSRPLKWKDLEFEYTSSPLMMINWPILLPELAPETACAFMDLIGARYPFSPHYEKVKAICPELLFDLKTDEWVFFGGSFFPWHKGHQACLDLLPPEKVCFILPDRNPLKELRPLSPVPTILELVSKIKFGKTHYIAPTFLLDFQKNPTYSWMKPLKEKFPEQKLSLLMGFDSFKDIFKWFEAEKLLNLLDTVYVVSRLEDDDERDQVRIPVLAKAPQLNVIFLGRHAFEGVSSTQIRKSRS